MDAQDDSLIFHLEALRIMLIKCLSALAICVVPLFFAAPYCLDLLIHFIIGQNEVSLNYFSPLEVFILQIKIALVLDLLVCFPYIARQVWLFLLPALYEHERKFIKSVVLTSSSLFIYGVLFCLFFILPLLVNFGLSFASAEIKAVWGVSSIMSLALWLSVVFGLMFQFPLITYSLLQADIVAYNTMKSKRSYIFVGILLVSGILTPPDIVSQLLLTAPTYLLFEIGLFFGKKKQTNK